MRRLTDADRLLEGRIDPDDAPPELRDVAALVRAARSAASPSELVGEERLVGQMAMAVRAARHGETVPRARRSLVAKALSAKLVVASAAAVALLGGGVAAAATGSFPAGVQRAIAHGLAHVGISVPSPSMAPTRAPKPTIPPTTSVTPLPTTTSVAPPPSTATSTTSAPSPAARGATSPKSVTDRAGLCVAYEHAGASRRAAAFSRLEAAAAAHGETVARYCSRTTPPQAKPATSTTPARRVGLHRPPATTPPAAPAPSNRARHHGPEGAPPSHRPPTATATATATKRTTPSRPTTPASHHRPRHNAPGKHRSRPTSMGARSGRHPTANASPVVTTSSTPSTTTTIVDLAGTSGSGASTGSTTPRERKGGATKAQLEKLQTNPTGTTQHHEHSAP